MYPIIDFITLRDFRKKTVFAYLVKAFTAVVFDNILNRQAVEKSFRVLLF